ncbi:MAG: anti-sigma factor family protein [Planctomycetota bacterium]
MKRETLEILIGKYLDGQISDAEQHTLQEVLDSNSNTRELFEQLQDLHRRAREAIACEVAERGKPADDIFRQASQQHAKRSHSTRLKPSGRWRFATGLAAGLVLGLALHLFLTLNSSPRPGNTKPEPIAQTADNYIDVYSQPLSVPLTKDAQKTIRNLDWYRFTDKDGVRWLVQGVRENRVSAAVYEEGL